MRTCSSIRSGRQMPTESGFHLVLTALLRPANLFVPAESPGVRRRLLLWALGFFLAIGGVTAIIQIVLLERAIGNSGHIDTHISVMHSGFIRLILVDRLLPPATALLTAMIVGAIAIFSMELGAPARRQLRGVLVVGMVPLLFMRIGELGATVLGAASALSPGDVMVLPGRFVLGPRVVAGSDPAPWIYLLDARLNLVTIWMAVVWAKGLRCCAPGESIYWPAFVTCLSSLVASLATWSWEATFLDLVLRGW